MKESFKIWFKAIPEGWKIFGAISGFIVLVSTIAIKIDHWKDKGISQANIISYLQKADHDQKLYNRMKDSLDIIWKEDLYERLGFISDSLSLTIINQQTLTNAVGTIGSKVTNTVPELFKLMGGLQFELIQPEAVKSVFGKASIRIIKIPRDSVK